MRCTNILKTVESSGLIKIEVSGGFEELHAEVSASRNFLCHQILDLVFSTVKRYWPTSRTKFFRVRISADRAEQVQKLLHVFLAG